MLRKTGLEKTICCYDKIKTKRTVQENKIYTHRKHTSENNY